MQTKELTSKMRDLDSAWKLVDGHHLERNWSFPDFKEALAFVNRVGEIAEELGHHPDITFTWGKVKLEIHTHDIDGISDKDFQLAGRCDDLS